MLSRSLSSSFSALLKPSRSIALPAVVSSSSSSSSSLGGLWGGFTTQTCGAPGASGVRTLVDIPRARDPLLFTPGPLTTSAATKQAMLVDLGSRDVRFQTIVKDVRNMLLGLAGVSQESGYECVIVQGSGTFGVEAVLGTSIPRSGAKLLIVSNGAYGQRMAKMATVYGIDHTVVDHGERAATDAETVVAAVKADPAITHVAVVHHETTAGTLNPIHEIGTALHATNPDLTFIVDSMSAFGAYPVDMAASHIDYLVSSSNKMLEGVPGFAYALCRRGHLETTEGNSRSLALDLYDQWKGLEANGQFRFTPPTHALVAFRQALVEHEAEGGAAGRLARYQANFEVLKAGMAEMGFKLFLDDDIQSCIISTFLFPDDPAFDFPRLYSELADRGMVLYPGKLTKADCFRVGSIGRMFESDMEACVIAIRESLTRMGVKLPVNQIEVE